MIRAKQTLTALIFVLFSFFFLLFGNTANAIIISPMTFCTNTCKAPHCQTPTIKQDCKKKCDESTWKQVASLELSKTSKEFRIEKDKTKKDAMLYSTSIAQCLDLKPQGIKESKPLMPPLAAGKKDEGENEAAKKKPQEEALKKKQDEALAAKVAQAEAKKKQEDALAAKKVQTEETRQEMLKRQQEQTRANFLALQQKKTKQAQKREALKKQHQEELQSLSPQDAKAAQELKRKHQEEQKALLYKHQDKIKNLGNDRIKMGKEQQEERIAAGYN